MNALKKYLPAKTTSLIDFLKLPISDYYSQASLRILTYCIMALLSGLFLMGITGILLTQVLPQFIVNLGFYNNPFAILLLVPQILRPWNITYPIFPWMSITLLGMGFGKCLLADKDKALTGLLAAGLICLAVSPIVRWAGGFGNFRNPVMFGFNLVEFLNVVKYPPSLVFTLMTLGGNFILLYLIEKYQHLIGEVRKPLLVFGQTALYFYFIHWFFFCRVNNN